MDSILGQTGNFAYDWFYVDDASGYSTHDKKTLLEIMKERVLFLKTRHFQLGAIAKGLSEIGDPNEIVCLVDGDDYLLSDCLLHIASAYQDANIAMTYGNVLVDFRPYQNLQSSYFVDKQKVNTNYSDEVWRSRTFRQDGFRCFHLRTFRRWLWDCIDPVVFYRSNKDPIRASGDSAFIFPMLELLGEKKHIALIETPIYVYRLHPNNVHCLDKKSQFDDLEHIRFSQQPFQPLDRTLLKQYLNGAYTQCVE